MLEGWNVGKMEDWKEEMLKNEEKRQVPLVEGVDYYLENGLFVFTAHYLEERGYCCKSGCRHCPYGFEKIQKKRIENTNPND